MTEIIDITPNQRQTMSLAREDRDGNPIGPTCTGCGKPTHLCAIPTGWATLDAALGIGGYPRGRVIEVFGRPETGKTTLALRALANAQRSGGTVALVDMQHTLDPDRVLALGVNLDRLLVAQPDTMEQALQIVESLVKSGAVDFLVVDSVSDLAEDPAADGITARLMSRTMHKLVADASHNGTTVLFVNELWPVSGVTFGNSEVTTGGNALKFYASVRIEVRRREDGVHARVVKNKLSAPFTTAALEAPCLS